MHFGAQAMLADWMQRYPGIYLSACLLNTSFLESKFGQLKGLDNGQLLAVNVAGVIRRMAVNTFIAQPAIKRDATGAWRLNARTPVGSGV